MLHDCYSNRQLYNPSGTRSTGKWKTFKNSSRFARLKRGWTTVEKLDIKSEDERDLYDMCEAERPRFLHVMVPKDDLRNLAAEAFGKNKIEVGCICAGWLYGSLRFEDFSGLSKEEKEKRKLSHKKKCGCFDKSWEQRKRRRLSESTDSDANCDDTNSDSSESTDSDSNCDNTNSDSEESDDSDTICENADSTYETDSDCRL